jgi:hypothetical protein
MAASGGSFWRLAPLFAAGLALTGGLLVVPLARVLATHDRTAGRVFGVFPQPTADGDTRLLVRYTFAANGIEWLCEQQADRFFRPIGDPTVDPPAAADLLAQLAATEQAGNGQGSAGVWVYYRPNDPGGSAFILDMTNANPYRRYLLGCAILGAGAILGVLAWNRRSRG